MLPDESILVEGLWDSSKAFLAKEAAKKRNVLLLTGGTREDHLFSNLSYFSPHNIVEFPSWETLPGEDIAPSPDLLGKRFEALFKLLHAKEPQIVLCPLQAVLQKIPPPKTLKPLFQVWQRKTDIDFSSLEPLLTRLGYRRVAVVSDKGEFALRGGILDLFPIASSDPFRIAFFGDEIEEIKTFDPVGQKSTGRAEKIFLSPAVEKPLLKETSSLVHIWDYFSDFTIFWDDLLAIEDSYVKMKNIPASQSPLFSSMEEVLNIWKNRTHVFCTDFHLEPSFEMFDHSFQAKPFKHRFFKIESCFSLEENPDPFYRFLFLTSSDSEEKEIRSKVSHLKLPPDTRFERGFLTSGYCLDGLAVIPAAEISHSAPLRRQKWRSTTHTPAAEFHALSPGDLVVHYHSGIGKYLGMEKQKDHLGKETEFLTLEYAEGSKLFVPISQAHLVSRYIGASDTRPILSELGNKKWQKTRESAQAQVMGYASELLQLYAERSLDQGFVYPADSDLLLQFERDFPYEETQDQLLAIEAIKKDMGSKKPMDRLICADVGYGKTEVAMRAAFKAVADGKKQVAVLVPTTVLAMQHFETFSERMSSFPVKVEVISRFHTPKQIKNILNKLSEGTIDILIGTHRILSKDVFFKDLGLIIIDEEQRFGVRAKEHLKKFKKGVDCLTLSATPIPRTLYMSLVQARDMSTIHTPPQDRLPIKTILAENEDELIQNALMREFSRGGQAFFIHNRVESIYSRASHIQKLVPLAKIGVVHGQMDPKAVDEIFHLFKQNEVDLLFATVIIENGIDIPNANTILIDRADTYGLANLYQIRGRVGRWNRSAYAYFLTPKNVRLSEPARKRLGALVEAGGYGGGMKVAMRDLEIRGAGDILGVSQSGQVSSVGFHLYCKMLKKAIEALKKKAPISLIETKIHFPYEAKIPESYVSEVSIRMELYYRLGEAASFQEIDEILEEMKDRFGTPPEEVIWLCSFSRVRTAAALHQYSLLEIKKKTLIMEKQLGKNLQREMVLLPSNIDTPKDLETFILSKMKSQHLQDYGDRLP